MATSYSYDFENRLRSITYPGGSMETYMYNYAGELIKRTTVQGTINYVYGQGVAPLAELKDFGPSPTTDFIQVNGKTVGELAGRARGPSGNLQASYYHTDATGNVLGITDDTATVVEAMAYDPFGVVLNQSTTGSFSTAYQYVGAYGVRHDVVQGSAGNNFDHSIMGVRMYDSQLG